MHTKDFYDHICTSHSQDGLDHPGSPSCVNRVQSEHCLRCEQVAVMAPTVWHYSCCNAAKYRRNSPHTGLSGLIILVPLSLIVSHQILSLHKDKLHTCSWPTLGDIFNIHRFDQNIILLYL